MQLPTQQRYIRELCMSSQAQKRSTAEEYLALERQAQCKSEYYAGEIFAVAGASRWHNLIVANVIGELRSQLKGQPCTTYPSDMRVKISPTGLYTYPDVTVVCGEAQFDDTQQDTLLNPTLIVEVLSESTAAYDRGGKFAHYRKLATLMEYVLITPTKPHIEHYHTTAGPAMAARRGRGPARHHTLSRHRLSSIPGRSL
jgi:Uma2 family endonuclease